jgi:flagellum-specific ATP synthase
LEGKTLTIDYDPYFSMLDNSFSDELGKVAKIVGLTVESVGPTCKLNDLCMITSKNGKQ